MAGDEDTFRCINCDWTGPSSEVDWGSWTPPGQSMFHAEPSKADCPECGDEVEHSP